MRVPRTLGGKVEELEDNSKRYISARREDKCNKAVNNSDNNNKDSDEYDSKIVKSKKERSSKANNLEDIKLGARDLAKKSKGSTIDETES